MQQLIFETICALVIVITVGGFVVAKQIARILHYHRFRYDEMTDIIFQLLILIFCIYNLIQWFRILIG